MFQAEMARGSLCGTKVPLWTCREHPLCSLELSSRPRGGVATSSPEWHCRC